MPWYAVVAIICLIIAPFDALYVYIKASRRKEKERQQSSGDTPEDPDTRH